MSNFRINYFDTDSVREYCKNDVLATKQMLNSIYGTEGVKHMNREYISVIVDNKPTVIFKRNIIAVSKIGEYTEIVCTCDVYFKTKEDYATVVKKIIG